MFTVKKTIRNQNTENNKKNTYKINDGTMEFTKCVHVADLYRESRVTGIDHVTVALFLPPCLLNSINNVISRREPRRTLCIYQNLSVDSAPGSYG